VFNFGTLNIADYFIPVVFKLPDPFFLKLHVADLYIRSLIRTIYTQ